MHFVVEVVSIEDGPSHVELQVERLLDESSCNRLVVFVVLVVGHLVQ